jgi:hypothetical protein
MSYVKKIVLKHLYIIYPNPGGLVANMTTKTQNCYDKFIIHIKIVKICNPP